MANLVRYGSSGDDVLELQKKLNQTGNYSLEEDGVYGAATQAAVRDYQQKNNLSVDGVAGDETWGSLNSIQSAEDTTETPEEPVDTTPDYSKYQYDPSGNEAYQQAMQALQQAQQQMPTYQGTYDEQLDALYDKIVNREDFSYDMNEDAFYQQAVDQYTQQGEMAMMDTMGQAAALTGGYGNTYAQNVGQQAYNAQLRELAALAPEYYQMALDRYDREGDQLLEQYSLTGDLADREYGRYQDALNAHWQNISYLKGEADDAYNRGADNWYNAWQMGTEADSTAYAKQQEAYDRLVSMMTNLGYTPTKEELAAAGMSDAHAKLYMDLYKKPSGRYYGGSALKDDDTTGPSKTDKFISTFMTTDQAVSRGIGAVSWKAMFEDKVDSSNLTAEEIAYLESYYGIE